MTSSELTRRIRVCWFALGLNYCIFMIFLPLAVSQDAKDLISIAKLFGIPALSAILGQSFFGWLCLRKDRFRSLIILTFISFLCFWLLLVAQVDQTWLFTFLIIHGFLSSAMIPSSKTLITLLHPERKAEEIGGLFASESAAMAITSAGIGWWLHNQGATLHAYQHLYWICVLGNLMFCVAIFLLLPKTVPSLRWDVLSRQNPGSFGRVFRTPGIKPLYIYLILVSGGSCFYFFYFGRYLKDILGGTELHVGLSMTLATLFGAIAYPLYGRAMKIAGPVKGLWLCFVSYILCFTSLHFISGTTAYVLVYALPLYPLMTVASNLYLATHTADLDRGVGFGFLDTAYQVSGVLAPLIGLFIFDFIGLQHLSLIACAVLSPALLCLIALPGTN